MLLFGQNQSAIQEFPCPVYIMPRRDKDTEETIYQVICGDLAMANYSGRIAAKLEIIRLKDDYLEGKKIFEFCKEEVKK